MFGQDEEYFLEHGLNLTPMGDFVPQEEAQQAYAAGYPQRMQQLMPPRHVFDYVNDALRQQQFQLQNHDRLQQELNRARQEAEQLRAQMLEQAQAEAARLRAQLFEQTRQRAELTPDQRETLRRRLYEEVYEPTNNGSDGNDTIDVPADNGASASQGGNAGNGETFAPVPWGSETGVQRVSVGE